MTRTSVQIITEITTPFPLYAFGAILAVVLARFTREFYFGPFSADFFDQSTVEIAASSV
jgi:hypothetical protein